MSDEDPYDIPQEINETDDDDDEDLGLFSEDVWAVEFLVMIRISKEELNLVQRNEKRQTRKARLKLQRKRRQNQVHLELNVVVDIIIHE